MGTGGDGVWAVGPAAGGRQCVRLQEGVGPSRARKDGSLDPGLREGLSGSAVMAQGVPCKAGCVPQPALSSRRATSWWVPTGCTSSR